MNDDHDIDALLSEFIDLLNVEGPEARVVQSFRERHCNDPELAKLMSSAIRVQAWLSGV